MVKSSARGFRKRLKKRNETSMIMKDHGMHTFIIVIACIMYECGIDCGLNCVLGTKWGVFQLDWLRYGI